MAIDSRAVIGYPHESTQIECWGGSSLNLGGGRDVDPRRSLDLIGGETSAAFNEVGVVPISLAIEIIPDRVVIQKTTTAFSALAKRAVDLPIRDMIDQVLLLTPAGTLPIRAEHVLKHRNGQDRKLLNNSLVLLSNVFLEEGARRRRWRTGARMAKGGTEAGIRSGERNVFREGRCGCHRCIEDSGCFFS